MTSATEPFPELTSANGDWFVNSSAWMRWSRCLVRMDDTLNEAIDISIEPMNHVPLEQDKRFSDYELDRLLEMRIRCHRTHNPEHRFSKQIPSSLASYISKLLGEYYYNFLMHEDIFEELDHDKLAYYDRCSNWPWGGGIPFAMVCRDRDKYPLIINHWIKVMVKEVHYLKVQDDDMIRRYNDYLKQEPAQ